MFWRKKKKESDPEGWESFAKELIAQQEQYLDTLVQQYRQIQEFHQEMVAIRSTVKELQRSRDELMGLLNAHTKWGDYGKTYGH